ncbi:MAG: hypothetical protein WCK05_00475, partial [Planctomycetota bacterium]
MMVLAGILAQCPFSGGGGSSGGVPAWIILAAAFGLWVLARFIWNRKGVSAMKRWDRIAIVSALVGIVIVVLLWKSFVNNISLPPHGTERMTATASANLPRLVDLGST